MRKTIIEMIMIFVLFFAGTAGLIMVDNICLESTGAGGKLVLDIDKQRVFK